MVLPLVDEHKPKCYLCHEGFEDIEKLKEHHNTAHSEFFESNEIILTNHTDDGNICNNLENTDSYYKMGTWDGVMLDGNLAPQGVYPFLIEYKQGKGSVSEIIVGYIILIR